MGAILVTKTVPVGLKKEQMKKWYTDYKKSIWKKYVNDESFPRELLNFGIGATAYTGDFATFKGFTVKVLPKKANSRAQAKSLIAKSHDKWTRAIAVEFKDGKETRWLIGGWAAT